MAGGRNKKKFILVALVVIVIVTASIGFYLIKDAGVDGITAMEGKVIADEAATNWNSSAKLINIAAIGNAIITNDGKCQKWTYVFYDNFTSNNINAYWVKVSYDGFFENGTYQVNGTAIFGSFDNIIDSTNAYTIATSNTNISIFLSKYPDNHIESFTVNTRSNNAVLCDNHPIWYIHWVSPGIIDNPHNAEIEIDANTGEVLYVEADN